MHQLPLALAIMLSPSLALPATLPPSALPSSSRHHVVDGGRLTGTPGSVEPQAAPATPQEPATPVSPSEFVDDDDMVLDPAAPEFTVVNLGTTLPLPVRRFAFRVTHRFARDLTEGDFGDIVADFFGLDSGARTGLELRFGVARGWQAGIYRANDRTIALFTQYSLLRQRGRRPVALDALVTFEGTNNFSGDDPRQLTGEGQRSPGLGAVISRTFGRHASVNATVAWVGNTNPLDDDVVDDDDTLIIGVGARFRVRPTIYLVGEIVPRAAGYRPGAAPASFGIEKRVGGHAFQVNFSNGLGSTPAQLARGGAGGRWHIGFNVNRKFY